MLRTSLKSRTISRCEILLLLCCSVNLDHSLNLLPVQVIIGYSAAAIAAFFFSEWLISRPLLNILLGWPIQLLGLTLLPYFGVKYLVEGDSISDDASDAFHRVLKKLPGFENKV